MIPSECTAHSKVYFPRLALRRRVLHSHCSHYARADCEWLGRMELESWRGGGEGWRRVGEETECPSCTELRRDHMRRPAFDYAVQARAGALLGE